MFREDFMPIGSVLPDGTRKRRLIAHGEAWQIFTTSADNYALAVLPELLGRWIDDGFIGENLFAPVEVNASQFFVLACKKDYLIASVQYGPYPSTSVEAHTFAVSLREFRNKDGKTSLHDALYLEQFALLLPTYTRTEPLSDDCVLGAWLSAGVNVSASSFEQLSKLVSWLPAQEIRAIVREAGLGDNFSEENTEQEETFKLPGRPALEAFFNEYVIDIVRNEEKYSRVGINFPSAIVLYGPLGCGKTFAVEKLAEFLGWPCYRIDSSTVGSPYIHETSRKTGEIFDEAAKNSPSVIVIDEMDAFMSDRTANNSGTHHVEEVSEFLRRIPEASRSRVLVIGMTNRLEAVDPALLRRGRFDHVIEVGMPSADEVRELLSSLFAGLPLSGEVNVSELAERLAGHPLSDAAFVVKEAGRLSVRARRESIDSEIIEHVLFSLPQQKDNTRKIGFNK